MRNLNEQERQQHDEMTVESVAKVVFHHLTNNPMTYFDGSNFSLYVEDLGSPLFSKENNRLSHSDHAKLLEAITLLERRGLVVRNVPRDGRGGFKDQFVVYLTSIGIKSDFHDGVLLLIDKPEEIVQGVEQKVGPLDDVIRQYYLESLRAYQEGLYISSVICLGAASERAIHWLAESTMDWLTETNGPNSERHRKGIQGRIRKLPDLAKYLSHSVIPHVPMIDETLVGKLKKQLKQLGDLYRENRNNAGHPKTIEQTNWLGDDQEILLIHFRRYITTIYEAIESLKKQSAS